MTSPNTPTNNESKRNIGALGATGVVVAAMIGTGIFTLSGVVGPDLVTTDRFVVAWIVAAIVAGLGGSVYSELAAANPNTGGHYLYWRTTFGRQATFIQCATDLVLVSVASVAAVAAGSAAYLHPLLPSAVQGILGESGPGRSPHLDCHRNAHPLGSLRQRGDHGRRDGQSGHPSCLLCLGVSE